MKKHLVKRLLAAKTLVYKTTQRLWLLFWASWIQTLNGFWVHFQFQPPRVEIWPKQKMTKNALKPNDKHNQYIACFCSHTGSPNKRELAPHCTSKGKKEEKLNFMTYMYSKPTWAAVKANQAHPHSDLSSWSPSHGIAVPVFVQTWV